MTSFGLTTDACGKQPCKRNAGCAVIVGQRRISEVRRRMANEERHIIHERSGVSAGMVAALVILAAAVIGLVVVLLMRTGTTNNENLATQPGASPAQTTTTVQQPAQQPPVVV